jgi:hypothetical protein
MAGHRDYPSGRDGVDASRSPIFYNESVMSGGLSYGLVAEHIHRSASCLCRFSGSFFSFQAHHDALDLSFALDGVTTMLSFDLQHVLDLIEGHAKLE